MKNGITSLSDSFETKSHNMEDKLTKITNRLGDLEVSSSRPMTDNSISDIEQKSYFRKFLSKGDFEHKSLSSNSDENGGYLIPQTINHEINDIVKSESVMRKLASNVTISSDYVDLLVSKDEADAGWAGECDNRDETKSPTLTKIKIPVHEMFAKPRATQKLLDDSKLDIESWLASKISYKMSQMENKAFILGTGEKQPKGFLTYPVKFGSSEWGKLEGFKTGENGNFTEKNAIDILIDTVNSLNPKYRSEAKWIMSRSAVSAISKLKDKNDMPLWNNNLNEKANSTLLGYEVLISDDMPEIDNEKKLSSIAFGNFNEGYSIVDRSIIF